MTHTVKTVRRNTGHQPTPTRCPVATAGLKAQKRPPGWEGGTTPINQPGGGNGPSMMHHAQSTPLVVEDAAPTPGHCGPATSGCTQGTNGGSTPRSDRGGDLRGSQGCATILAHTGSNVPKNSLSSETDLRPVAANGSPQTTNGNRLTPNEGHQSSNDIDRTNCPGKENAHRPDLAGTLTAYKTYGCRCPDARQANRDYARLLKQEGPRIVRNPNRGPVLGVARRIRALATLGWSNNNLANYLNCTAEDVETLRRGKLHNITPQKHARIANLYQLLSDRAAPPTPEAAETIAIAEQNGWSPPIAWDDDTIDIASATPQHQAADTGEPSENEEWIEVYEYVHGHGHRLKLTPRERKRIYPRMLEECTRRGASTMDIAKRLGVSDREVLRIRAKLAKASAEATAA